NSGRGQQRFQQIVDLTSAAARQNRQQSRMRRKSVAGQGLSLTFSRHNSIQKRMTHEGDLSPPPLIKRSLERGHHRHPLAAPQKLADTPSTPCANLWQDVVKDRDPCSMSNPRQD